MQRRRRRLALAAGFAAATAVLLSLSLVGVTGNDVVRAAVSGSNSLSELFGKRSPGERTAAELTKTRRAMRPTASVAPPDRRSTEPPEIRRPGLDRIAQVIVAPPPSLEIAPPPKQASIDAPTIAQLIGFTPEIINTSPSGGSSSFPASEPHHRIAPVAPVPEPATWATMLLGFALLGWRIRRRPLKRAAREPVN